MQKTEDGLQEAQERVQIPINILKNIGVPYNAENFFTTSKIVVNFANNSVS
jgi:hypothetical protein